MVNIPHNERHTAMTTVFRGGRASARQLRCAQFVVVEGPDVGKVTKLQKSSLTGGRSIVNDLVLTDKAVSGTHFKVTVEQEGYRLRDMGSRNGIYVGDMRVSDVFLGPVGEFRIGQTVLQFQQTEDIVEIDLSTADQFGDAIGGTERMREIFAQLEKVAASSLTCMIFGETGTGKELIAKGVHKHSLRSGKPFVVLDCGAIPKNLIESTLFGHEKGSFTGAETQHRGCFEQADGGTIFLDEIGELDISLQPKLLRVLEQREITRVGGNKTIHVDVRVVAATNRDLLQEVGVGNFREDLFFRLSVVQVEIPPLRERQEDIPLIVHEFVRQATAASGIALSVSPDAMSVLQRHSWPGNVRELRNVITRAATMCEGSVITKEDIHLGNRGATFGASSRPNSTSISSGQVVLDKELIAAGMLFKESKKKVVEAFEKVYLRELLDRHKGNITRSAEAAGLTRYHLRELVKRHNKDTPDE